MCNHNRVTPIYPITPPKNADNLEMVYWECFDCGETFDTDPRKEEDDEVIDERKIMRDSLFH
jgi:hypothetical protein